MGHMFLISNSPVINKDNYVRNTTGKKYCVITPPVASRPFHTNKEEWPVSQD